MKLEIGSKVFMKEFKHNPRNRKGTVVDFESEVHAVVETEDGKMLTFHIANLEIEE